MAPRCSNGSSNRKSKTEDPSFSSDLTSLARSLDACRIKDFPSLSRPRLPLYKAHNNLTAMAAAL